MTGPRRAGLVVGAGVVLALGVAVFGGAFLVGEPDPTFDLPPIDLAARVAERPVGGDADLLVDVPVVTLARSRVAIAAHEVAGGPPIVIPDWGPTLVEAGFDLAIVAGPVLVSGEPWLRVYVLPNVFRGPTDFFTWVPQRIDGAETIDILGSPACPPTPEIGALAVLDPFTRLRCLGADQVHLRGQTWERMLPVWYRVAPEWWGDQQAASLPTVSVHAGAAQRNPNPGEAARFLDLQLPPGLDHPPLEFEIEFVVHAADADAPDCSRLTDAFSLVPPEGPEDGLLWCSSRLVVEQWTPIVGPEGRPIDATRPQLHRHPARGGLAACGGVGMPPLTLRIDPLALDPVWLETAPGGPPIIASFSPEFALRFLPEPVLVDGAGRVVGRNGTAVDPDRALAGHAICPGGLVVSFD